MYVHTDIYTYIYTYTLIYLYTYIPIYTCIYAYMHICIYAYIYLYLNSRTRPRVFNHFAWSKIAEIRPKLLENRSILVGRPQTLELGSNARSLRSNFIQNCSSFQQEVVQLAQNIAKSVVLGSIFVLFRGCSACAT